MEDDRSMTIPNTSVVVDPIVVEVVPKYAAYTPAYLSITYNDAEDLLPSTTDHVTVLQCLGVRKTMNHALGMQNMSNNACIRTDDQAVVDVRADIKQVQLPPPIFGWSPDGVHFEYLSILSWTPEQDQFVYGKESNKATGQAHLSNLACYVRIKTTRSRSFLFLFLPRKEKINKRTTCIWEFLSLRDVGWGPPDCTSRERLYQNY